MIKPIRILPIFPLNARDSLPLKIRVGIVIKQQNRFDIPSSQIDDP